MFVIYQIPLKWEKTKQRFELILEVNSTNLSLSGCRSEAEFVNIYMEFKYKPIVGRQKSKE